ncbi:lantibiotic dehydratase [Streptomyces sioyaensis]|uniref:lantibiotic dehydratase n=1 Tax=Streptomyces sioyaensis TaxID=67364 RepID=UPI0037D7BA9C
MSGTPVTPMPRTLCTVDRASGYVPADFFLLRAPALPFDVFQSLADCHTPAQVQSRLRELGREPRIQRAVEVADSDLADALRRVVESPAVTGGQTVHAHSALFRLLTRMATRTTPLGSFAGVALGDFGTTGAVRLESHGLGTERFRADMAWLMTWIRQLEEDPATLTWVRLTANDAAYYSDDRLALPLTDLHGEVDRRSLSVRAGPPVRLLMQLATGVPYGQLVESLCASFPQAGRCRAERLVTQLYRLNLLTSDLRPPLGEPYPERWLLSRLEGLPGDGPSKRAAELRRVVEFTRRAANGDVRTLRSVQRKMAAQYKGQTYQVDSALAVSELRLPEPVAADVAEAADCLVRLAAAEDRDPLASYHAAFRERYSENALIPVQELLSPERGLDSPSGYQHPRRSYPLARLDDASDATFSAREQELCEIAARALQTGAMEVELTDDLLNRLGPEGNPAVRDRKPVTALDVFVQIQAESIAAIDKGHWRAVVTGTAPGGGTCGRFAELLGPKAHSVLARHAAREEQQLPGVACAELSYLPLSGVGGNVAVSPRLHTYEIPVNATPSVPADRVIALDDILVGATRERLYLWSRRLDREIVVTQNHRLNPGKAPNICRFLLEVSRRRRVSPYGFCWGAMRSAPFLPRIVRGRAVLSLAQWRLSSSLLGGAVTDLKADEFTAAVRSWRKTWRVPRLVDLFEGPDPLMLDLDQPLCLAELQAALRRRPDGLVVREPTALPGQLWLRDEQGRAYTAEVVVPLISHCAGFEADRPLRSAPRAAVSAVNSAPRKRHLPGGSWSPLTLYAAPHQHDRIIAGPLRELITACEEQGLIDRWFFNRGADPRPHLCVRLRARTPDTAGQTLADLLAWGRRLTDRGIANDFSIVSYKPELERYGGAAVFDDIERSFEAGSRIATELIAGFLSGDSPMDTDCLIIAALDALYTHWGLAVNKRLSLAPAPTADERELDEAHAVFRTHHEYLCGLLTPGHEQGRRDRQRLLPVLLTQQSAVARAAQAVRTAAADDNLWGTESSILSSLAHMEVNRLAPMDRARERRCYLLWRHTLRAIRGRSRTAPAIAGQHNIVISEREAQ